MKECLFICFLGVNSIGFSQTEKDVPFSVDVNESSMFFNFNYYINSDSIYVVKRNYLPTEKKTDRYTQKWTEQEKAEIVRLAKRIKIRNLKTSYYKDVGDDYAEFIFYFNINGYDKKVVIYKSKVGSIADFVAAVNKGLPDKYKVGYNKGYFGK